jgi:hypothetical protein
MIEEIVVLGDYCYKITKVKPQIGDIGLVYDGGPDYLFFQLDKKDPNLDSTLDAIEIGFPKGWIYKIVASDDPKLLHLPNF